MNRRRIISGTLVALLFSGAFADVSYAQDWPQWRGIQRDAISPERGLSNDWEANPPELMWTAEGLGSGYSGVSVTGDFIYSMGDFDDGQAVVAIDANSSSVVWKTTLTDRTPQHGHPGSRCTPTIDGDRLYVVTSDGQIACLNAEDGQVRWKRDFHDDWQGRMMSGWGFSESPLVDGDWVLCTPGGDDAMIVALDKHDGSEVWRAAVPDFHQEQGADGLRAGAGYSSIVVSEGAGVKQYVQLIGRGVIGVRAEDGEFLWGYARVANGTANIPTPVVSGDYVFSSTGYNTGSALLQLRANENGGVDAEEVYFLEGRTLQNKHGGLVLAGGHLYGGHGNGTGIPICVELETGEVQWGGDRRGPGRGEAAVIYADGNIVFRFQDGTVALIEATPDGYHVRGSFMPDYQEGRSWAHPVISDGRLLLREQDKLMCYDLREQRN